MVVLRGLAVMDVTHLHKYHISPDGSVDRKHPCAPRDGCRVPVCSLGLDAPGMASSLVRALAESDTRYMRALLERTPPYDYELRTRLRREALSAGAQLAMLSAPFQNDSNLLSFDQAELDNWFQECRRAFIQRHEGALEALKFAFGSVAKTLPFVASTPYDIRTWNCQHVAIHFARCLKPAFVRSTLRGAIVWTRNCAERGVDIRKSASALLHLCSKSPDDACALGVGTFILDSLRAHELSADVVVALQDLVAKAGRECQLALQDPTLAEDVCFHPFAPLSD